MCSLGGDEVIAKRGNDIGDKGAHAFAKALKQNTTLTNLK